MLDCPEHGYKHRALLFEATRLGRRRDSADNQKLRASHQKGSPGGDSSQKCDVCADMSRELEGQAAASAQRRRLTLQLDSSMRSLRSVAVVALRIKHNSASCFEIRWHCGTGNAKRAAVGPTQQTFCRATEPHQVAWTKPVEKEQHCIDSPKLQVYQLAARVSRALPRRCPYRTAKGRSHDRKKGQPDRSCNARKCTDFPARTRTA